MRKFLSILGGLVLFLVFGVVAFVGYMAHQGQALDQSSKAYIEESIPAILSSWSKNELLTRASPQLLEVVHRDPELLDKLFGKLSELGSMREFEDVRGDSHVALTTQNGKIITASYTAKAGFEKGDARIAIRLIQLSGQWQILNINVDSPIFLQ